MLSAIEIQRHLEDCLFHRLQKLLHNTLHYLYDDLRVIYPPLETVACKDKSEHEDKTWEGV